MQNNRVKLGKTIIDPYTKDIYLLNKEIGSYGCCHVYRALYSRCMENDTLVPSGHVTLKIINKNLHESDCTELQRQVHTRFEAIGVVGIGVDNSFTTQDLLCVSFPYMSEGSLRYILSARTPNNKKMPEYCIAIVLREALLGLRLIHNTERVHRTFNQGDIFVHIDDNATDSARILIKLAFEALVYDHSKNINTEGASSSSPFLDVKALELAYGDLPVRNREDLNCIITKLREKKRWTISLEKLLKKKGIIKKTLDSYKRKEQVFAEEFEKMVLICLREDPEKRPTADQLLNNPFFRQRDMKKFEQFLLSGKNPGKRPIDN
ncbi:serine/threonine-protein kinase BLUS1-like [Lycium barbarum]|uniref:serine/threonine-protein kinase BLUS1-like n=1 Tax=Lycium barbarum TaxID=112863 RepID=UPI00293F6F81|nr:serine/threonine-protein kinase BLUS1-like [Lycium barbarum]